jgi:adenylate kinase family enzyme
MHVVLLIGSSTAGKSSLCKELVAEHKWNSGSVDEAWEKVMHEQSAKAKPLMLEELKKQNMIAKLQSLMTEDEVQKLAGIGIVNISKGNHKLTYQFQSHELDELEEVLKKAGFDESEIPELAKDLRLVTTIGNDIYKSIPPIDPMERLYDETFKKDNSGKQIVLDVIPDATAHKSLDDFEKRVKQYRDQNPGEPLTTSVVFAYCPPQKLSERIQERNRKAEIDNPMDKRIGSFPFDQLATLAAAEKKLDTSSKNLLSRTELFYLINRHASTDKIGDALFLENPIDPEALQPSHDQKSQTVTTTISDTVKINPYSDDLELTVTSDKPRIGSKKTIEEYGKLANKFGFFENQERASLNIPSGLSFDAVINTARGTPATLANEFLEKLEKSKTSSHRISKL